MTPRLCRRFPLLFLFSACLQLPSLSAAADGNANSTDSCNLMHCANLGTNLYPFGASAACAASPSYVLSSCTPSSTEAHWDSFSDAALGVVGSPAVTALARVEGEVDMDSVFFRLYWNKSPAGLGSCPPLYSSTNLSLYNIPSSINLTRPADNFTLNFTPDNTILLFGCNLSRIVGLGFAEDDNSTCSQYENLCGGLSDMSCVSWKVTPSSLQLQFVLDYLACSHFMFGVFNPSGYNSSLVDTLQFSPAVFEVLWTDMRCRNCAGECIFDEVLPQKFKYCRVVHYDDDDDCDGGPLQCSTGWKVGVGVAATVGFLGICVLIRVGFRRFSNVFINVSVPVVISAVISILKRILRKLQWISYRLKRPGLDLADLEGLTERLTEYSYSSLASATKSFSHLVAEGGFGTVYRGTLTTQASKSHGGGSEEQIAVKVLEAKSKHSKNRFLNEVASIGKIHHVNVVRLLGFCVQEDHNMLVYEYVVNGSLDKWLFSEEENPQEHVLDWGQRFAIALGVARGLNYLHEECRHRTVHCDIKPQNILLDAEMHPKIADLDWRGS